MKLQYCSTVITVILFMAHVWTCQVNIEFSKYNIHVYALSIHVHWEIMLLPNVLNQNSLKCTITISFGCFIQKFINADEPMYLKEKLTLTNKYISRYSQISNCNFSKIIFLGSKIINFRLPMTIQFSGYSPYVFKKKNKTYLFNSHSS